MAADHRSPRRDEVHQRRRHVLGAPAAPGRDHGGPAGLVLRIARQVARIHRRPDAERVDGDPEGPQLQRKDLRHMAQRRLGHRVGRAIGQRGHPRHGGGEHDPSARRPLGDHLARRRLRPEEGALQVQARHRVPGRLLRLQEGAPGRDPGVGREDVQPAEPRDRPLHQRRVLCDQRQVDVFGTGPPARLPDALRHRLGRLGGRVMGDDHRGAGPGQRQRHGRPDLAVRPGHDGDPAREHAPRRRRHGSRTPRRPARSVTNCQATRPERPPRVCDHSIASARSASSPISMP